MRHIFIAILFAVTTTHALAMSKADCSAAADKLSAMVPSLRSFAEIMAGVNFQKQIDTTTGTLHDAVTRADSTRIDMLPALRTYEAALEDLVYQLQLCARGP